METHISASLAAGLAHEAQFQIREADVIGPLVRVDRDRMAALVILTVDKHAANPEVAHLGKGNVLRAIESGHALLKRGLASYAIGGEITLCGVGRSGRLSPGGFAI